MNEGIPALLMAAQTERRRGREAALNGLTEREQRLFREAAVMGYVLGGMGAGHHGKIPPDSQVLEMVRDGCLANGDLYPIISRQS